MKLLSGVLSGLIIGAALVFATLAVMAIVANDSTCTQQTPAQWALRLDVPAEELQARVPAQAATLRSVTYTMSGLYVTDCGGVLVVGKLAGPGALSLNSIGAELSLQLDGGDLSLRPSRLWFGRLPLDVSWLPEAWWRPVLSEADAKLSALVARGLAGSGMEACGVAGNNGSISLYLCQAGAPTT